MDSDEIGSEARSVVNSCYRSHLVAAIDASLPMTTISPGSCVLGLLLVLRLVEFWLSRLNAERRLADGSVEHGEMLHLQLSLFHAIWLAILALRIDADTQIDGSWLIAAGALLVLRATRLVKERRRWTWRLFTDPGHAAPAAPTQLLSGLAYMPMLAELLVIPLVFGLWWLSLAGAVVYAWLAWQRAAMEHRLGITPRA